MFKKILILVGSTDRHQQGLDIAASLAIERAARDHLATLGRYIEERQVSRREEVIFGDRAHEIVRYAMERSVDLIVLSSHRIDLQNPGAGWGTMSYKVGILSQC